MFNRLSPEQRAWLVLYAALLTCCALAVGVPAAAWAYMNSATVDANVHVRLRSGILRTYGRFESENDARVVSLEGRAIDEGVTVDVGPESVGLLTIGPDPQSPLVTVQLYSNTRLRLVQARHPRFPFANRGDWFVLRLERGRVQVLVSAVSPQGMHLELIGEHGKAMMQAPGTCSMEQVEGELRVSVSSGTVRVSTLDEQRTLAVSEGQRTAVNADGTLAGVLPPVRNLVRDGDFRGELQDNWLVDTMAMGEQGVRGVATVRPTPGGGRALFLERVGDNIGWGRTAVTQLLNEDVRDRRSLRLQVDFQILEQQIPVCGGEGSECPLMVRIDYRTQDGSDASWIQGFYALGTPDERLPDYIRSNPQNRHIARRQGAVEPPFESENLLELLPNMQSVRAITLYAEGHAVRIRINSVALWVVD
ncbi:MAG: hypothetical protein ACK4WM_06070 [Thermoflexales bacterium]